MNQALQTTRLLLVPTLLVLSACGGDDITGVARSDVTGTYNAVQFITTPSGGASHDELAAGSTVTIVLKADGSTTGHLHVAAFGNTPAFDADLAGFWSITGNTVTFTQNADTFIRNMSFTVSNAAPPNGVRLSDDRVFQGTRVQLTLQKPLPV